MSKEKEFRLVHVDLAELDFERASSAQVADGIYTTLLNKRTPTTSEKLDVLTLFCNPEDKESLVEELQKL